MPRRNRRRRSWRNSKRYRLYSQPSRLGSVLGSDLLNFGRWHRAVHTYTIGLPNRDIPPIPPSIEYSRDNWYCHALDRIYHGQTGDMTHRRALQGLMRIKYHCVFNPVYPADQISDQTGVSAAYYASALSIFNAQESYELDWMIFAVYDTDLRQLCNLDNSKNLIPDDSSTLHFVVSGNEEPPHASDGHHPFNQGLAWLPQSRWFGPRPDTASVYVNPFYSQRRIQNDITSRMQDGVRPHVLRRGKFTINPSQVNSSLQTYQTSESTTRELTFQTFRHPVAEINGMIPIHKVEWDKTTADHQAGLQLGLTDFPLNVRYFIGFQPKYLTGRQDPFEYKGSSAWGYTGINGFNTPVERDSFTHVDLHLAVDYWEGPDNA